LWANGALIQHFVLVEFCLQLPEEKKLEDDVEMDFTLGSAFSPPESSKSDKSWVAGDSDDIGKSATKRR